MTNIFDAARYILDGLGPMLSYRLQILCYYAQGWSLAWDGEELFPEDFEAAAMGPSCPELRSLLTEPGTVTAADIPPELQSGEDFSQDQKETLDAVMRDYSTLSTSNLGELVRTEPPWKDARAGTAPGMICRNVIAKGDIARYYAGLQQDSEDREILRKLHSLPGADMLKVLDLLDSLYAE